MRTPGALGVADQAPAAIADTANPGVVFRPHLCIFFKIESCCLSLVLIDFARFFFVPAVPVG
jgi:hypothetical protein